ncbi:MAG: PGF-pre-PGF domain-containing protein [Candidatus Micrarchaeota archaeon]|nr:PGF-pre-PGF domain-containing protein [Candidatus Micrarchaeota archaeon]
MKNSLGIVLVLILFGLLSAASIELITPLNNSFTNQSSISFTFNATFDENPSFTCMLYINGIPISQNNSVENSTITVFTQPLNTSFYQWYINCTNGTDIIISEIRTLTIDLYGINASVPFLAEPDSFISSNPANNKLTLLINASDIGPAGIDYLTANFTALNQPGITLVNMTYNNTTGLWNATITITDVSMFNFAPLNVTIFGQDKAGNGILYWTPYTTVILYNMSVPGVDSECYDWGPEMTDLTAISNFNSVNFTIDMQINVSCIKNQTFLPPYPSWLNEMTTVAILNFTNLNLSNPAIGSKLAMLSNNIKVNITLPNQFGDSRIFVNSTALAEFDTNATIKLFHLPFLSKPEIISDAGADGLDEGFTVLWAQGNKEGNLTFRVKGFSGYNITDNVAPIITINTPLNSSYVNSTTPTINITLNGTKTAISYLLVQIDNTSYIFNSTVNQTNCQATADPEIMNCVFQSASLSQGGHTIFVLARDFGGVSGNSANKSAVFTVDSIAPVLNISTPQNNTILNSVTLKITGASNDANLNYTNISVYNNTGNLVNSTTTTNTSWVVYLYVPNNMKYNISINAFDKAGNNASYILGNITVNDTTAPKITAISATTSGSTVTLSVTTDEFAVCRYATTNVGYEQMLSMDTTGQLVHTKSITFNSSTSGTFYVACADPVGNEMVNSNTTTFSVTVSSGSSGGGSTTTVTTLPPVVQPPTQPPAQPPAEEIPAVTKPISIVSSTASTATFNLNTVAGEPLIIDVAKLAEGVAQATGISKISITTSSAVSNVQFSIKPVEKPASIQEPAKKVLNYIEINFGTSSQAVQSAKITFTLKKSDISKQNVDADTIKLLRYANGQWQELQTEKGFEDIESITFEATTPGFSYFAIAGEEIKAPAEAPKITTTKAGEEKESGLIQIPEQKKESPLGLILLIAVILIIGYIVLSSQKPWKTK